MSSRLQGAYNVVTDTYDLNIESGALMQMRHQQLMVAYAQRMAAQNYEEEAMRRNEERMFAQLSYHNAMNKAGTVFVVQNQIEKDKKVSMMLFRDQLQTEISEWCGGILLV